MNIFIENIKYYIIDNFYTIKNYLYRIFINCIEYKTKNNIIEEKYKDEKYKDEKYKDEKYKDEKYKKSNDVIIDINESNDAIIIKDSGIEIKNEKPLIEINNEWAIIEENDIDPDVFYNIGKYLMEEEAQIIYRRSSNNI
jgi:hypothetical protein